MDAPTIEVDVYRLHNAMERFEELKDAGRRWIESIDHYKPDAGDFPNSAEQGEHLMDLEAVFRRILGCER